MKFFSTPIKVLCASLFLGIAGCSSDTVEERSAFLEPNYAIHLPEGEGPFPTVLLFHGCGGLVGENGPKQIMDRYAKAANDVGYAAIVVDSFGPREISFDRAVRRVCSGLQLRGARRAGDVIASLAFAETQDFAKPDAFVLAGWSHGGWSVMEAMIMDLSDTWAPGLRAPSPKIYDQVHGVYLTYPYCGFPSRARKRGWAKPIPTQIIEAGQDVVAKEGPCHEAFDRMTESGVPVNLITFEEATHAFDEEDQVEGAVSVYNPDLTDQALKLFQDFLINTDA
ncbi:MAG: dienelactone hydrolase family protein [Pseudomonadota bacterium]